MNERIKAVRLAQMPKLSQEAFGDRIGVTGAAISRIESGDRNVTDQVIIAICREFGVSEEWLRTGEGEMFVQRSRDEELSAFFGDILSDESEFKRRFMSVLSRLNEDEWAMLERMANSLVEEMQKEKADP